MSFINIETIKMHLRLPLDPDAEVDTELIRLCEAAEDYAAQYMDRVVPFPDGEGGDYLPKSVEQAILILLADMYENREEHVIGESVAILPTAQRLMHFFRKGLGV